MTIAYLTHVAPPNNNQQQLRRRTTDLITAVNDNGSGLNAVNSQLGAGVSGTITIAKLTVGGNNGSITVTGGIITGIVNPT